MVLKSPLTHHQIGALGERVSTRHLKANGYQILTRNWNPRKGEIDIVALHRRCLIAFEVKTRRFQLHRDPLEELGSDQLRRIETSMYRFLRMHSPTLRKMKVRRSRIDLLILQYRSVSGPFLLDFQVNHYEDILSLPGRRN